MKIVSGYKVKSGKNVIVHRQQLAKVPDERLEEVIIHIPHADILKWADEIRAFELDQEDGHYET